MGTLHLALDQTEVDRLIELVRERIADVQADAVTGFAWDKETELEELDSIQNALLDAAAGR